MESPGPSRRHVTGSAEELAADHGVSVWMARDNISGDAMTYRDMMRTFNMVSDRCAPDRS